MPKTKSAKKALRQNICRREKNLKRQKKIKSVIKEYKKLLAAGKKEEAKNQLSVVYKTLDKMAKVKLIKRGKANRMKSRLSKKTVSTKA
ncbi:MAG: 30S ribosomal protein S20 [Patescibacteria group bacterium]|nr:30S ribosomal protein S20 [Patescibacteria group bacterium]